MNTIESMNVLVIKMEDGNRATIIASHPELTEDLCVKAGVIQRAAQDTADDHYDQYCRDDFDIEEYINDELRKLGFEIILSTGVPF